MISTRPFVSGCRFITEGMKMAENIRYSRLSDILDIIVLMQSKVLGITLTDIQDELNVSRRTAERLRDAILNIFPQIDEIETDDREKHWGFTSGYLNGFISFSPEEIATIENIKENLEYKDKKQTVESVVTKLKALSRKNITNVEDAIEIILKTEGVAVSQKPNYKVSLEVLETIRQAIKENRKVEVVYRDKTKVLSPYGIIYGSNIHLIAMEANYKKHPYNYVVHKISKIKLLNETFDKGDFDIKEYASRSFGVFQGEIIDVELLFDAMVQEDVLNHNFHPTQKVTQNPDGTVTVTFKASGTHAIMWHLFKWSDNVKIISPQSLKDEYINWLTKTLDKQQDK